jgi:hypothetical protein
MNVDGHLSRSRPKKRWIDCLSVDMRIKRGNIEMTSEEENSRSKQCCADTSN